MTEVISVRDTGHVRTITLNRPERKNAHSAELAWALVGAIEEAARKRRDVIYVRQIWALIMFVIRSLPEGIFKKTKI
jgi:1,4-dihydroxy-2-naphthoyl-CoA synthase